MCIMSSFFRVIITIHHSRFRRRVRVAGPSALVHFKVRITADLFSFHASPESSVAEETELYHLI